MSKSAETPKAQREKKAYRAPTLKTYGNVHQITRSADGFVTDNGKPVAHKTGLQQQ
jgi:hypothetical protein